MSTPRLPASLRSFSGLFLLAAAFVVLFAPTVGSGFVLDDFFHLERVTRGAGLSTLDYCIRTDDTGLRLWWLPHGVEIRFFRPLLLLFLRGEARCFGLHAAPFHVVSLALHALNMLLCFLIGRRLGLAERFAATAAMAWGVSIHTVAAVGWISAQSELLAAAFVLGAVYCFLRSGGWLVVSGLLVVLALLTRETAVAAPLLMLALRPRNAPRWFLPALVLLMAAYIVLRIRFIPMPPPPYGEPVHSFGDVPRIFGRMLRYVAGAALGIPVLPLVLERTRDLAAVALVGGLATVALLRVTRERTGMWWFIAALLPCLLVMPTSMYLYVAACGVFWLLGRALQDGSRAARVWMTWLVVTGIAGHILAAGFVRELSLSIKEARNGLIAQAATDAVLVEAPWWSYCLPAAARLKDPSFHTTVHLVSVSPALRGARAEVRWKSPRQFDVVRPNGFFHSPFERFFLFDGDPCAAAGTIVRVTPQCANGAPVLLGVTTDAAVFVFDGWRMVASHP